MAGQGFVIAAGIRPSVQPVSTLPVRTDVINPVRSKFVGSSIGAIDFTDTDEAGNRCVRPTAKPLQPANPSARQITWAPVGCHPGDHLRCNREC